jgi:hypothetical protein
VYLLVFHVYINEVHGSRSKIPSKKLARHRCAERFNSVVKGLITFKKCRTVSVKFLTEKNFGRNRSQDAASGHFMSKIFRAAPVILYRGFIQNIPD